MSTTHLRKNQVLEGVIIHGGKRLGAGRKKGIQNKVNAALGERVLSSGESPLECMLRIVRDPKQEISIRNDMAKAAAPYVHPRLQAVEHADDPERSIQPPIINVHFINSRRDGGETGPSPIPSPQ